MRIHNSLRNNFLGVILFAILLVPGVVNAANKIVNYKNGSFYYVKTTTLSGGGIAPSTSKTTVVDNDGKGANDPQLVNLWNANQNKKQLSGVELDALKIKLAGGGSSFNNVAGMNQKNVSSINTDNNSTFVYDPTPDDKLNNDEIILGTATKNGHMLIPENPPLKDQPNVPADSNDLNTGNGFLNYVDKDQNLPQGTTVANKNRLYNAYQAVGLDQQKIGQAITDQRKAQDALDAFNASGSTDAVRKAELEANLAAAKQNFINTSQNAANNQANLAAAQNNANASAVIPDNTQCSITNFLSTKCVLFVIARTTNTIFKLVSFLAYIAGTLFDYSLELSINSAQFFKKLGVIEVTWSFIRDILNMTFIFILLWTAVQILIGNDAKYNAKQVLTKVIIVAILINFSLFAAKLMVDGSNVVSLKIYEAMKSNTESKDATISERVMNTVGLSTLYNITDVFTADNTKATGTCANNDGALITISVMGSIFLIILTLALGLAAILFLVRLVNIIVLFIKSPLWVWGYVLPGNSFVSKQKDEWWNQMKHVLTFPIAYLFWMLVAVIIFDSLGSAKNGTGGLLDVICNGPTRQAAAIAGQQTASGAGAAISLVAIFCIVIIFMMKAIEYGVSHAAGPSGSVGGDFSKKWANKFAGYQTAMTKGLAKKAGNGALAVGGASVGAANRGLIFAKDKAVGGAKRTGGMLAALAPIKGNDDSFKERMAQGFLNPGIYTKERLANLTGRAAVLTGSKTLAQKSATMQETAEKARKEIYETRTKGQKETEEALQKVAAKQYKADTQEEWEKKNGAIGDDANKALQYEKYVESMIEKQANARLGKDVIGLTNKAGVKHLDAIRDKAINREEIKDAAGNTTGFKIKINNGAIASGFTEVAKQNKDEIINQKKGLWKPFRTKGAEAKFKVLESALKAEGSKYSGDKDEKDIEAMIKKIESKLSEVPEEADIDKNIKAVLSGGSVNIDKEILKKNKNLRKLNDLFNEYGRASATRKAAIEFELHDEKESIVAERNKMSEKLVKEKNNLAKQAAAKEKKSKENK